MYVKEKGLWSHLDGISKAPTEKVVLDAWEIKDAQIISWIFNTIDPHMINNLRYFSIAQDMWNYLKRIYNQDNTTKRFPLELERTSLADVQAVYNTSKWDQFLMKLRPEFTVVRGALLNRNYVPYLDTCIGELLKEEERLLTQGIMSQDSVTSEPVAYLGHIISDCCTRPPRPTQHSVQAFHATTSSTIGPSIYGAPNGGALQSEMIQQLVLSTLSALSIQGKSSNVSNPWFLDSGASNHMDVLVSSELASNLLFVGQLVGNNCNVNFSRDGCLVQEQVSRKVIVKGPKVRRVSSAKRYIVQRSCPYTSQQNGMTEHKNRHLLDVTRTLLLQAYVPFRYLVEALSTAPDYSDLRTFGCLCFVHLPPFERHKLGVQSAQCTFIGYTYSHKGFVCYDISNQRFRISRNVITPILDPDPPPDPVAVAPRCSGRASHAPDKYLLDKYTSSHTSLSVSLSSIYVPTCYSQVVKDMCWIKICVG
ncbi:uncharacterized protein [Cicer arietinum]|uniref:uncharacterized protein n=1 Tax=Cicer arietinum TaxID=3827 RepID=UPI003CC57721